MFKEIKGCQYLGYGPQLRDADRLTFGVSLIGISLAVILAHCAEVCIYIHQQVREKTRSDTASQKPDKKGCGVF